ncbi:uncharacterized protein CMC5_042990 [Chondromyces crocatus]|uniref:Uncharacterized protein n=1 Tax=Chondromyces crocatus TaxID=52 RepID=A0A0K1EH09_CHOCO|nr:uncharacterized protein CMC5_042990 [Chondromyces crocatus]
MRTLPRMLSFVLLLAAGLLEVLSCTGDSSAVSTISAPASCLGEACSGDPQLHWKGPVWLWSGPEAEAPPCPPSAPLLAYEGHAGLQTQGSCDACECTQPECKLPAGWVMSFGDTRCGAPSREVLAPPDWDGSCFSFPLITNPRSVSFWPSTLTECEPLAPHPSKEVTFAWETRARACGPIDDETCTSGANGCPQRPVGFQQCVYGVGPAEARACPEEYPEARQFNEGVEDRSACSPCECLPPETSRCHAFTTLSMDHICKKNITGTTVDIDRGNCVEAFITERYGSVSGRFQKHNEPGACTHRGGELTGEGVPTLPTTFCCQRS